MPSAPDVTQLLAAWSRGDEAALAELTPSRNEGRPHG